MTLDSIRNSCDVFYILPPSSGAGGQNAYGKSDSHVAENEAMGMKLEYFTNHYGFTFFSISKKEITVSFVGADGSVIYQYTRNNKVHPLPTLPTVTSTSPTRPVGKTFLMR